MIRILVVDDEPLIGGGLAALLRVRSDVIVSTVTTGEEALRMLETDALDLVTCDILLSGVPTGFAVVERLLARRPGLPILMVSSFEFPAFVGRALEAGASGYLTKGASPEQLAEAVQSLCAGGTYFPAHLLRAARGAPTSPSPRECDVLRAAAEGLSNEAIAHRFGIAPKTVESHLRRLFTRYGAQSRTELVVRAMAEGWIAAPRH